MWRCDFSKIITASVSVSLQGYESGEPGKNGLSPFYTAMRVGEFIEHSYNGTTNEWKNDFSLLHF